MNVNFYAFVEKMLLNSPILLNVKAEPIPIKPGIYSVYVNCEYSRDVVNLSPAEVLNFSRAEVSRVIKNLQGDKAMLGLTGIVITEIVSDSTGLNAIRFYRKACVIKVDPTLFHVQIDEDQVTEWSEVDAILELISSRPEDSPDS